MYAVPQNPIQAPEQNAVRVLVDLVAKRNKLHSDDLIHSLSRDRKTTWARHELRWLLKELRPETSFPVLARMTGAGDHTTVIHSIKRMNDRLETDALYADNIERFKHQLKGLVITEQDIHSFEDSVPFDDHPELELMASILEDTRLSDQIARSLALNAVKALRRYHG